MPKGRRVKPSSARTERARATTDELTSTANVFVASADRIHLFAAENDDGTFRVDESVRRDPDLFLAWLQVNEPESVLDAESARINALNGNGRRLYPDHADRR